MAEDLLLRISAAIESNMLHGMMVIDREFKVAFINDSLCNMWRVHRREMMHRSILKLFHEGKKQKSCGEYVGPLIESMDKEIPVIGREVYLRLNTTGQGCWFQVNTFLLHDKNGQPEYAVGTYVGINRFKRMEFQLGEVNVSILNAFTKAINARDQYTRLHSDNVSGLMGGFAEYLQLPTDQITNAYLAGMIHDVGKIVIPEPILNKPGRLTEQEYEVIKMHSTKGAEILQEVVGFGDLAHMVRHHHERYDGKGYPDGIGGEVIPFHSRMLAICDSYDAMTSARCYSTARSTTQALQEIQHCSGQQFDPELAMRFGAFVKTAGLVSGTANDQTA